LGREFESRPPHPDDLRKLQNTSAEPLDLTHYLTHDVPMNTTITLSQTAGRVAVTVGDEVLATVKDGSGLMGRVDSALRHAGIVRGGFTSADGVMTAPAADLR
jgi:hypothetical protein